MTRPSYQQEGMWIQAQVLENPEVLHLPICLRVRGPLDYERFHRAVCAVVHRHDALRYTFRYERGRLGLQVSAQPRVDAALVEIPGSSVEDCRRRVTLDNDEPMDLARGPLVRLRVYRFGEADAIVLLTMHHIIVDAVSLALIRQEVFALYGAMEKADHPAPSVLPSVAMSYAEFAAAQRMRLAESELRGLAAEKSAWLAGTSSFRSAWEATDIEADARIPAEGTRALPAYLADAARAKAKELRVSEFIVMLAAFRISLWLTTGVTDGLIGVPISGRVEPGSENIIGYFLDLHPLKNTLDLHADVDTAIKNESRDVFQALEVPELSHWRLREARGIDDIGLGDIAFSYRPERDRLPLLDGYAVEDFLLETRPSKRPLTFDLERAQDGSVRIIALGDRSLLTQERVDKLLDTFLHTVREILADSKRPLAELTTVGGSTEAVERTSQPPGALLLRKGSEPPLFCLPALTGSPAIYLPLVERLPSGPAIWGLHTTDSVGTDVSSLHDLAAGCAASIRRIQPRGPYRVLGWSFGGALAQCVVGALDGDVETLVMLDSTLWIPKPGESAADVVREQMSASWEGEHDPVVARVAEAHVSLLNGHQPPILTERIHFVASEEQGPSDWVQAMWGDYAAGGIDVHQTPIAHADLLAPHSVGYIADIVARALGSGRL